MTGPATPARPRQVATSGWLIILGSVFVVVLAFQRMSSLGSIEFQEQAARTLADPPADGLGLSVDDVQTVLRVLCYVAAASAVAAAILGREVLRRSASARLALSVLAPALVVAGFAVATVPAMFVAVGIAMLWVQPARDWFAGRAPVAPQAAAPVAGPPAPVTPRPTTVRQPPAPTHPYVPYPQPGAWAQQRGPRRPGSVVGACVVTWVSCGIVALVSLMGLLVVLVARDELLDQLHDDSALSDAGISDHAFVVATVVAAVVLVPWCLAASALAVGAFRGVGWAWVALLVCASVAGVACLFAVAVGGIVGVVPLAASVVTVMLLLRSETRAWLAARRRP